ncbi:DoxX family protein [Deinococcus sonorensis]|uniref:DoxX family protein n=2 Tax=Deinococcus sonorensis TaxID=309891 RepID=A0AAU7UCS4_9DEIO
MTTLTARPSRALHLTLWALQVLLAAAFLMTGVTKLITPILQLAQQMAWVSDVPAGLVRFIGLAEVAGALGLILPSLTRIRPNLTPLAALCLIAVMVLASAFHLSRGEPTVLPMNLALAVVAGLIAWGRARRAPIQAR